MKMLLIEVCFVWCMMVVCCWGVYLSESYCNSYIEKMYLTLQIVIYMHIDTLSKENRLKFVNAMQEEKLNKGDWLMHQVSKSAFFFCRLCGGYLHPVSHIKHEHSMLISHTNRGTVEITSTW